jgi:hypothetical protein
VSYGGRIQTAVSHDNSCLTLAPIGRGAGTFDTSANWSGSGAALPMGQTPYLTVLKFQTSYGTVLRSQTSYDTALGPIVVTWRQPQAYIRNPRLLPAPIPLHPFRYLVILLIFAEHFGLRYFIFKKSKKKYIKNST